MSFSEPAFVSLFLPLAVAFSFLLRGRGVYRWWHSLLGLAFLLASGWQQPLVLLALIALNLMTALLPGRARTWAAVLLNVGAVVASRQSLPFAVPMGLSYLAFQALCFHLDQGKASPKDFAFYLLFFPKLPMGPLARYAGLASQHPGREGRWEDLAQGLTRFVLGLAKKVLIADRLALLTQAVYGAVSADRGPSLAVLGMVIFPLQLYMDFSGYTDMALGMARAMGFSLPENFLMPLRAGSMRDFWRRWHITLGAWMRDYVYIPLGGSRKGALRTACNTALVYALIALWHGSGWGFLLWGLWNALWLTAERQRWVRPDAWAPLAQRAYVYAVTALGFVPFAGASGWRAALYAFAGEGTWRLALAQLRPSALAAALAIAVIALEGRGLSSRLPAPLRHALVLALLCLCLVAVYGAGHVPFLYAAY